MSEIIKQITSIEEFRNQSQPLVDIIGFEPGQYITVRLKRISLMALCKSGKIPNSLLQKSTELFTGKKGDKKVDETKVIENLGELDGINQIIDTVCEAAMIEPKFEDVKEFLTDEQKTEIFQWTQGGVKALESFRTEQGNSGLSDDE